MQAIIQDENNHATHVEISRCELIEWLREQTWSDFAQSLVYQVERGGTLSQKQWNAALNMRTKCKHNERKRLDSEVSELDLSDLPDGWYAVPGGDTRLKLRVSRPTKARWKGYIFVDDGAVYGHHESYGYQRPGRSYTGKAVEALRAIAADPFEASKAYGRLVGRCGVCSRPLENEESVKAGIGPICARKF